MGGCLGLCNTTREGIKMSITAMKTALSVLTDTIDMVRDEYERAVELYGGIHPVQPELMAC
jgi:hypothetical protein